MDFSSFMGIVSCHFSPGRDMYCTLPYSVNPWFMMMPLNIVEVYRGTHIITRHARWLFSIISTLAKEWWNIPKSQCTLQARYMKLVGIWDCKRFERVAKGELLESFVLHKFHIDTWLHFDDDLKYLMSIDPRVLFDIYRWRLHHDESESCILGFWES